jgi:4-hydroxy-tetrahydrodipicolinate synthase
MTMRLDWLRGCATALVTPFRKDGAIDDEIYKSLVERQIAGGVRLLVPCGTTGESVTMSEAERLRVIRLTIEAARGKAKVIAGTGSNNTAATIDFTRKAREAGADAALVVAPYYNKPTQDGMYAHFAEIAKSVKRFPLMLYNVPSRTASNISAATTLPLISVGADGLVSVCSNEIPKETAAMVEKALSGAWTAARKIHYKILPLMEANFIEASPAPCKFVMKEMNLLEENLRLPLVPVTEASRKKLREILKELNK